MLHHRWDISPSEAIALQKELAGLVRQAPLAGPVETVAGTDCAFADDGRTIIAAAVLCEAATMEVIARVQETRPCKFPYVPGLLSFREAPAVIAAMERLPRRPDLLLCDGQGLAHPRGLGLACHVGLWLDLPTVGVAKSLLCGQYRPPARARGRRTTIRLDGRAVGTALRTREGVRPLFVSVGHRITAPEAVAWVLRCGRGFRLPEPTRQAHQAVSRMKILHPGGSDV